VGSSPLVLVGRNGPVVTLTLNRADRHNSLVPELLTEMLSGIEAVAADESVRAVVLAAAGRSFSTGGDVRGFYEQGDRVAEYARQTVGLLNEVIVAMLAVPQPIIAAVHGMVTGGSLGLVLGSNIVLVSPEATFTPWYNVVGFSPDGGWTALLPVVIGRQRAARVLLTNATITAEQAVAWGMASDIVPAENIAARAAEIADVIAGMQPGSVRHTKVRLSGDLAAIAAGLEDERRHFVDQIVTAEAREGMARFLGA
jgi:2-(1,2-epoxy-1,2-dihydrophenyl)acetyl-CoA isomerase